jgi:RHS repeat-associated protein
MKTKLMLAILPMMIASALHAQSCYTPITSWQGTYTLSTNSGGSVSCGPPGTCTVDQKITAQVHAARGIANCSTLFWDAVQGSMFDTPTSLSATDVWDAPGPTCDVIQTVTYTGGLQRELSVLEINPAAGTYIYGPGDVANGLDTITGCSPSSHSTGIAMYPGSNWPQTFSLPASTETLTEAPPVFNAKSFQNAVTPWTFSFTLTPAYHCKDCEEDGGDGLPVSSSISSENQSLGEDVPIVGTGIRLHYESSRASGAGGSASLADVGGWSFNVHHTYDPATNTLYFGDGRQRNGFEIGSPLVSNGNTLIMSEDGSEVYAFSSTTGLHVKTLRPMTGAVRYKFGYDAARQLVSITDASNNVTKIQRNASEQPTAIVSPFGQTTTLAVDGNGLLSQVTDPAGKSDTFVNTNTGLLTSRTDRNGNSFTYTYDVLGRLFKDADPLGGFTQLTRTDAASGLGWTSALTTSMGRTSNYQSTINLPWVQNGSTPQSEQHLNTWPNGLQASSSKGFANGQLSNTVALPNGTTASQTLGPDPVWGLALPVNLSESLKQGNLTLSMSGARSVTLGTPTNPFTVTTETDTQTVNGHSYTSTYTGSNHTWVYSSPVGRTVTVGMDSLERIASAQIGGLAGANFLYDTHGRLASFTVGSRKTTFSYNPQGFLASLTDPLNRTTTYSYDADGGVLSTTLADGRVIAYTYDANGNLTSVTPPGKSAHNYAYNAVDYLESYTPPTVPGTDGTTYGYNLDRDLTSIRRPDGAVITYKYDSAGRLSSVSTPTGSTTYSYNSTTGNLSTAVKGTEHIAYGYNGPLPTKSTWSGTVAGSVSRSYDDNFRISSESINGGNTILAIRDNDGLITKLGSLILHRGARNGLITGTTLGVTTDTRTYNAFGELTGYTASVNGTAAYSIQYTRDAGGRIMTRTDTVGGTPTTYSYTYDLAGRLASATKGATTDTYTYDENSNRLSAILPSRTVNGTYDAQDRLLTYGNASYAYTANGEMASQTIAGQKTTYTYDALGNLIAVALPNGTQIAYVIDPENHRVGKQVKGVLQNGFLYDDETIVAELNGSNVSQFVYATGHTPDYMVTASGTFRIFSDQLGSPLLVVNTTTGAIAEQISYDEFGNVLSDTNPGFQPFGFAGGLFDQDTKLVRMGARDYNPGIGRWMAKDPIVFNGDDTNLYAYAFSDPVNLLDIAGTDGADAGTPESESTWGQDITNWIKETLGVVDEVDKGYNKCKKGLKVVKAVSNGVDGVNQLATDEANNYVKNNTGAMNEQKRLAEENAKTVPWVQKYADALTQGEAARGVNKALGGQSCPKCKKQADAPDPKPPQRPETPPPLPPQRQPSDEY